MNAAAIQTKPLRRMRELPLLALPPAAFAFAIVTTVAAADGGYFPTSWGWSAVGCLLIAFAALTLEMRLPSLTRPEAVFLTALLLFLGWTALSSMWSASTGRSLQEAERTTLYAGAVLTLLLLARAGATVAIAIGVAAAATGVSAYALATRLLPDLFGYAGSGIYRLERPLGYWNGLALLAALGLILSFGLASDSPSRLLRIGASGSVPILATTLYFTFSRGGSLALALGLLVSVAVDPGRRKSLATKLALAILAAVAVGLASRASALVNAGAPYSCAVRQGHQLAVVLTVLVVVAAATAITQPLRLPRRLTRPATAALALSVIVAGVGSAAWLASGGRLPPTCKPAAGALQQQTTNLPSRLLSSSGSSRLDYWQVAVREYAAHPLLGSGAGTWELYWMRERPLPVGSRFAHNLYLQTLAELGPIGLILLTLIAAAPLLMLRSVRRRPLVAATAGAYAAALAHTGIDWDWQLPAVTTAALLTGTAILLAARESLPRRPLPRWARASLLSIVVLLAVFAGAGWIGNHALALSARAIARGDYRNAAAQARIARRWQPWASEPWHELGLAQIGLGSVGAARSTFLDAVTRDPSDWQKWVDVALTARGRQRAAALRQAKRLNPLASAAAVAASR